MVLEADENRTDPLRPALTELLSDILDFAVVLVNHLSPVLP
jgi:DNA-directed RNA polymerase subunit K/omega